MTQQPMQLKLNRQQRRKMIKVKKRRLGPQPLYTTGPHIEGTTSAISSYRFPLQLKQELRATDADKARRARNRRKRRAKLL